MKQPQTTHLHPRLPTKIFHTATSIPPNTAVHAAQHEPVLSPAQEDINFGLNALVFAIRALTLNAAN